jgi:hypothetical protein
MKTYQIELKEFGHSVKFWGDIQAPDALAAIDQVCLNEKPYQEWIARPMAEDFNLSLENDEAVLDAWYKYQDLEDVLNWMLQYYNSIQCINDELRSYVAELQPMHF